MNKVYSRIIWKNYPNTSTALNETNLNRMDKAIDDLDNRVIEQDSTKANQTTVNNMVKNWTMDETTGVITVEKQDGSKIMFDLNIEKIPVNFELSPSGILTMTTSDGTQFTANIGSMIPVLTFNESDQIAVSVSGTGINKTYSFSIKDNSITENKLQPNFLADIKVQSANASLSANNAETSATQAQSYAIGGTGTRENEDTDNAMYYYEQAKQTDIGQISSKVDEINSKLSEQLGSHTVKSDVPENAVFTDTVYDDTQVQKRISDNGYGEVAGGKNLVNHNIIYSKIKNCSILFKNDTFYVTNKGSYSNFVLSVPTIVGKSYTVTIKDWSDYSYRCIASVSDLSDNTLVSMLITDATLSMTFTAVGTESLINISPNNTPNEMSNTITFKCMLEEGSVATEYEPYFPSNKMIAEENSQQSTEMMDIKMLGWSVPRECPIQNEVNGNQFIQKVGRVDLGSLYWGGKLALGTMSTFVAPISNIKVYANNVKWKIYCSKYTTRALYINNTEGMDVAGTDKSIGGREDDIRIEISDTSYTDVHSFKQSLQGQYLYYELATYNTMTIDGNEIGETVSDVRKETTVNLLNPTLQTTTQNGVTCTNNGDGTYTFNGTNSNNYDGINLCTINLIKGKTYKWVGQNTVGRIWFELYDDDVLVYNNGDIRNSFTFEVPTTKTYTISIGYIPNEIYSGIFKPMITTNLNATYDDFVPYTGDGNTLTADVAGLKNDLDKLNALPIGTIIQIEADKDTIATTEAKYSWQYLGTSNIQYENGGAYILEANVYRKNN